MTVGVVETSTGEWIVGLVAVVVFFFVLYVIVAFVLPRRHRGAAVDEESRRQSSAEPWGSIALTVFFLSPVVLFIARALGGGWLSVPMPEGVVAARWALLGGSSHRRELTFSDEAVEWRTVSRRRRGPLDQVVAVTDPARTGEPAEVWLSDGTILQVPASDGADAVVRTPARRIGQPWLTVGDDGDE